MTPSCKELALAFWDDPKYGDLSIEAILWIIVEKDLGSDAESILKGLIGDESNI